MQLSNLKPAKGATHSEKRIARGTGSGHGGTATRGHKGDKARSGHKNKRGHEGGQTPLQRRLPKFGFKNINRVEYVAINLSVIEEVAQKLNISDVSPAILYENGYIKKSDLVKILAHGELKSKLNVTAHACSATAKISY
ncbi:MAG: 50S ribosomal protein L15 [Saprospiraceae bacterium]|nr:50S ribosomal protein L15 [Saprospiraceae bacterium]